MSQIELLELQRGLFQPAAVKEAMSRETDRAFPKMAATDRLKLWQQRLANPEKRRQLGEQKHRQSFLRDVFEGLLDYRTPGEADPYDLEFELSGPMDSRPADGALGRFGALDDQRVRTVIEVKGPGTDLDARSNRKDNLSAVDQAFLYASHQEDCWWVIVSNFDEIRLYQHSRGTSFYERFLCEEISDLGQEFTRFHFLLHRHRLIGNTEDKPVSLKLAELKWRAQAEITKKFYGEYQEARIALFEELREQNLDEDPLALLGATQLLLDRLLFVMFCSDRGLLPRDVVRRVLQSADPKNNFAYGASTLWDAVRGLFDAINVGRRPAGIQGYNGGLFEPTLLDKLTLKDRSRSGEKSPLRRVLEWYRFDFDSQIDVEILGHIFENSISDLEQLRAEIASDPTTPQLSWRNREGIFYTPEWVTRYIVRHTVGRYLESHLEVGPDLTVLDPACGSGAFLTRLLPLFREHMDRLAPEEMKEIRAVSEDELTLFTDPSRLEPQALYAAIRRSVYGVDRSPESVEITKLSFWLQTAVRGRPLPRLDENIRHGNSLCEDPNRATDALVWQDTFPSLSSEGVHCIVGNPPWVGEADYEDCLKQQFEMAEGSYDLAFIFMELALKLLKQEGLVGFIVPDSILINKETEKVRRLLAEENTLHEVIKLGEGVFPAVFRGSCILTVEKGPPPEGHKFAGLIVTKADREIITDVTTNVNLDVLMAQRGSTIPLERILNNERCEFDIFVGEEDEELITKIADRSIDWSDLLSHGRGIELNSEGWVVCCPNCLKWDAPPEKRKGVYRQKTCSHCGTIYELEKAYGSEKIVGSNLRGLVTEARPFIDGTDVNRYRIEGSREIDVSKDGISYKTPGMYRSPKIVFRQAGVGITATIDYDLSAYVPQSVYVFSLKDGLEGDLARYSLEYVLGVLNSRVMLYYYFKKTGQIEWQSYPRWTLGRVTNLPVRSIDWSSPVEVELHDRITADVQELICVGATGHPSDDLNIERLVMDLYGLSAHERQRVWETLRSVQDLKIIREVLPANQMPLLEAS